MRVRRGQPREEVEVLSQTKASYYDNTATKSESNSEKELELKALYQELNRLKKENTRLKKDLSDEGPKLTSSEKKIIGAIRSELLKTNKKNVVISRNKFIKEYKVSGSNIDRSIESLVSQNLIERVPTKYNSAQSTWAYSLNQEERF